jgi:hypothetical protein
MDPPDARTVAGLCEAAAQDGAVVDPISSKRSAAWDATICSSTPAPQTAIGVICAARSAFRDHADRAGFP